MKLTFERAIEQIVKDEDLFTALEKAAVNLKVDYSEKNKMYKKTVEEQGMNTIKYNAKEEALDEFLIYLQEIAKESMELKLKHTNEQAI